jgi:hypothetical protein
VSFHRQQLAPIRLVRDPHSELADLRARVRRSHEGRDCSLTAQFGPQDFASDGHGSLRYGAAANESLRPAQSGSIGPPPPYMGIDGEGGGTDYEGRQNYILISAANSEGTHVCHRDGEHLITHDCLEFLLSLPPEPILIGFYFMGYDANQILRGIIGANHGSTIRRILNPNQGKYGPLSTYWRDYAITYQPGKFFRVSRIDPITRKIINRTCRTVYEAFGFFQCSFVDAITKWNIGSEKERAIIVEDKNRRADFSRLTDEIKEYCTLECRLLAMLMEEFRETCTEVGIRPREWSGAGELAAALFKKHGIPKRPLTPGERAAHQTSASPRRRERDPQFEIAANSAYYGGRFEISRLGRLKGPIYESLRSTVCTASWHSAAGAGHTTTRCRRG